MSDSVTLWTTAHQASLSITNSRSLFKFMSIESVMPSNHLNLCRPLLLPPSIFPSIRVFPNVSVLHIQWPKYWSSSLSISPSNEYSGLIFFRMDWLDLLAVQGTFNMLSRLVITFLPRSKCLLISWLQLPSAVILEPRKIKFVSVSPSICHEVMGPDAIILVQRISVPQITLWETVDTFLLERILHIGTTDILGGIILNCGTVL